MAFLIFLLSFLFMVQPAHAQPAVRYSIRCEDSTLPVTAPVNAVFGGAANVEIVPLSASKQIRVFRWILQSTVDVQLKFVQGTGTNCGTGEVTLVDVINPFSLVNRPVDSEVLDKPIIAPASKALCLDSSAAATITGFVIYCSE